MTYELISPSEDFNYTFNWATRLGNATISTSTWAISPTGPTLDNQSNTTTTATTYVSGCTKGEVYRLTNTVTTSAGTTEQQSITLYCETK